MVPTMYRYIDRCMSCVFIRCGCLKYRLKTNSFTLLGFHLSSISRLQLYVWCQCISLSSPPTHICIHINQNTRKHNKRKKERQRCSVRENDGANIMYLKMRSCAITNVSGDRSGVKYSNFLAAITRQNH